MDPTFVSATQRAAQGGGRIAAAAGAAAPTELDGLLEHLDEQEKEKQAFHGARRQWGSDLRALRSKLKSRNDARKNLAAGGKDTGSWDEQTRELVWYIGEVERRQQQHPAAEESKREDSKKWLSEVGAELVVRPLALGR